MIVQNILRYWTTDDADVLDAFLTTARERYAALEDALTPITEAVDDLERDWAIRQPEYWMAMTRHLLAVRDATKECVSLFERERSSEATPVALVVPASAPNYTYALYTVLEVIGHAGLVLTSYSVVCQSMERKHPRQRQEVFYALCDLNEAVHEAISEGRAELEQAPMLHTRLISSPALPSVRERYVALRTRKQVVY